MKQTLIFGNFITMDPKRPFAKAAWVKDGLFAFIGGVEDAKKLAGPDAEVLDYGENYIYPGFLESHCHGHLAGVRAIGQADLTKIFAPLSTTVYFLKNRLKVSSLKMQLSWQTVLTQLMILSKF